jgi:hypothetical protein
MNRGRRVAGAPNKIAQSRSRPIEPITPSVDWNPTVPAERRSTAPRRFSREGRLRRWKTGRGERYRQLPAAKQCFKILGYGHRPSHLRNCATLREMVG